MTQNTNPTLKESDIIVDTEVESDSSGRHFHTEIRITKEFHNDKEAEELKQQILTSLTEYPNLKEQCVQYEKVIKYDNEQYGLLTTENEELKNDNFEKMQIAYRRTEDVIKLEQELTQLRQLKQRVELLPIETMIELCQNNTVINNHNLAFLQQLLELQQLLKAEDEK